jgi:hypothetical protein
MATFRIGLSPFGFQKYSSLGKTVNQGSCQRLPLFRQQPTTNWNNRQYLFFYVMAGFFQVEFEHNVFDTIVLVYKIVGEVGPIV